jgi:hypothetical protein
MRKVRWLSAAAPLLVLFAALGVFAQQGEPPIVPPGQLRAAIATQEQYTDGLMLLPNVIGTAVTADPGGRGAIVVYARAADVRGLRADLDGFPVILQVTGDIVALQANAHPKPDNPGNGNGGGGGGGGGGKPKVDPTARFPRPVPIGVSTGHPAITAGTIGARVVGSNGVFALSNNHVYADENQASKGDHVIQPGSYDGGSLPGDDIGTLADYQRLYFDGTANTIDAAIASTTTSLLGNSTPADGYGTPRIATVQAAINMNVMKYGRTTGQTKGRVQGLNATINVGYDSGTALFVGQIVIGGGGFSSGGDSGSLIVVQKGADARKPVGLLFAGGGGYTIANPIDLVLNRFGVSIDGS